MSSFVKRRLGLASSSMAFALDQIPESILPAISLRAYIPLGLIDIVAIVLIFLVGELALSYVFSAWACANSPISWLRQQEGGE